MKLGNQHIGPSADNNKIPNLLDTSSFATVSTLNIYIFIESCLDGVFLIIQLRISIVVQSHLWIEKKKKKTVICNRLSDRDIFQQVVENKITLNISLKTKEEIKTDAENLIRRI